MNEIRKTLLQALDLLGQAGMQADPLLVSLEAGSAETPSTDERPVQTLGALSREIWDAHRATRTAIKATHQYEELENARG